MDLETLAEGRALPPLLFVTTADALDQFDVSDAELRRVLRPPHRVAVIPDPLTPEAAARSLWRDMVPSGAARRLGGVVLLGGYETLPSRIIGVIDKELRARLEQDGAVHEDADHYYVWNDDHYADRNGDGLPELPVSRIPAGCDLARALRAAPPGGVPARPLRRGVRIESFEYGARIYNNWPVANADQMLVLSRETQAELNLADLRSDYLYLTTHGDSADRSEFFAFPRNAHFGVEHIPTDADGMIVFAGVCWSACVTRQTGFDIVTPPHAAVTNHDADNAIPLAFVARGAQAFIGFTAQHWIPKLEPYDYFGAPLHRHFWENIIAKHLSPARALFEARLAYIAGAPYRHPSVMSPIAQPDALTARNMKDFWSASCLGLGW